MFPDGQCSVSAIVNRPFLLMYSSVLIVNSLEWSSKGLFMISLHECSKYDVSCSKNSHFWQNYVLFLLRKNCCLYHMKKPCALNVSVFKASVQIIVFYLTLKHFHSILELIKADSFQQLYYMKIMIFMFCVGNLKKVLFEMYLGTSALISEQIVTH